MIYPLPLYKPLSKPNLPTIYGFATLAIGIAMLIAKKRLNFGVSATDFFILYHQKRRLNVHAINPTVAQLSVSFDKSVNNDPADRLILATALTYQATLITGNENLKAFSQVKILGNGSESMLNRFSVRGEPVEP